MKPMIKQYFKRFTYLLILTVWVIFYSCSSDRVDQIEVDNNYYSIPFSINESQTRRFSPLKEELVIENVVVLFYELDGTYAGYTEATIHSEEEGSRGLINIPKQDYLIHDEYQLLIAGNLDKYLDSTIDYYINKHKNKPYDVMRNEISGYSLDRIATPLPFCGVLIGNDNTETTFKNTNEGNSQVFVSFTRSVGRVDVINTRKAQLDIQWIKLSNYRTEGYLYHNYFPRGDIMSDADPLVGSALPDGYVQPDKDVINPSAQYFTKGGLYCFGNLNAEVSSNDKATTCLLIAGIYKGENTTNDVVTYYRLNIADDTGLQLLNNNTLYTVRILNVDGPGADTEEDALTKLTPNIKFKLVDEWGADTNIQTDDKGNYLRVSDTYAYLKRDKGSRVSIQVATNPGGSWNVKSKKSNVNNHFAILEVTDKSFVIQANSENTNDDRVETFIISVDNTSLSQEVQIIQMNDSDELNIIIVDSKIDDFEVEIPAEGGLYECKVATGSANKWITKESLSLTAITDRFTESGEDGALFVALFEPNGTGKVREASALFTVAGENENIKPITITFTQTYLLPSLIITDPPLPPSGSKIYIEGLQAALDPNYEYKENETLKFSWEYTRRYFDYPDDEKYKQPFIELTNSVGPLPIGGSSLLKPTFKVLPGEDQYIEVTSTFHPYNELYVKNGGDDFECSYTKGYSNVYPMKLDPSKEVTIMIFPTGPGDDPIVGELVFHLKDKNGNVLDSHHLNISIITSCDIPKYIDIGVGEVAYRIPDRNFGSESYATLPSERTRGNSVLPGHPDNESMNKSLVLRYTRTNIRSYRIWRHNKLISACTYMNDAKISDIDGYWSVFRPESIALPTSSEDSRFMLLVPDEKEYSKKLFKHYFVSKGRLFIVSSERNSVTNNYGGVYLHDNTIAYEHFIADVGVLYRYNVSRLNKDGVTFNHSYSAMHKDDAISFRCMQYIGGVDHPDIEHLKP